MSPSTSPPPTAPNPDAAITTLKPQSTAELDTSLLAVTTSRVADVSANSEKPPVKKIKKKRRNVCPHPHCGKRCKTLGQLEMHMACCPHRPEAASATPSLTLAQRGLGGGMFDKMERLDKRADT